MVVGKLSCKLLKFAKLELGGFPLYGCGISGKNALLLSFVPVGNSFKILVRAGEIKLSKSLSSFKTLVGLGTWFVPVIVFNLVILDVKPIPTATSSNSLFRLKRLSNNGSCGVPVIVFK